MSLYKFLVKGIEAWKRRSALACVKTHTVYTRPLGPDSVVVDLGANVGDFSDGMNSLFGCLCYAVEALPNLCDQIPANPKIHKFNVAVSDKAGPIRLFTSANRECNSLFQSIAESYGIQDEVECPGVVLESFLAEQGVPSIDVLKLDVEGAEKQVFASAGDEFLRGIGQITIEFHDFVPNSITVEEVQAICNRLKGLGFLCIPASYIYPTMKTADFLFINPTRCRTTLKDRIGFQIVRTLLGVENLKSSLRPSRPPGPRKENAGAA